MKHVHKFTLALIGCASLVLPIRLSGQQAGEPASMLTAQIDSLRTEGKFAEALGAAKELLKLRQGDATSKPFELVDAEDYVSTLEFVVGLPAAIQLELAKAYDWLAERTEHFQNAAYAPYSEDLAIAETQLAVFAKVLGSEHPDAARSLNILGNILYTRGDFAGAEPSYREALAVRRKALDNEHPDVASSLHNLGNLLYAQGHSAEAEPLYQEALSIRRKALGNEHPDVARSLDNLGNLLENRGGYAGAESLYQEAYSIRRKVLGNGHPDVARSLDNLGNLLCEQGHYAEAEPLYQEALSIRRKALGNGHPDVAASLDNLGDLLYAQGEYAGAEPLYQEAFSIRRKALGNEHPDVARSLDNLGTLLCEQGNYAAAEPLLREALAIRRKIWGTDHPAVAASLGDLGILLSQQGDYAGAEPLFREALAIGREFSDNDPGAVAWALRILGILLDEKGDYGEAEPHLREALAIDRKVYGNESPDVATDLHDLGTLFYLKEDYGKAEPFFREALAIWREVFGNEHPHTAMSVANLGSLLSDEGNYEEAEPLCREALAIRRKVLGSNHPNVAGSLNDIGTLLYRKGDYAGAERELSQAAMVWDASRSRVDTDFKRATFRPSPYPTLAATRLQTRKTTEAWPAVEKDLGRALMDLLVAAESRPLTRAEAAVEDSLKRVLDGLEREVAAYQEASVADTTGEALKEFNDARDQLIAVEAEWAKFQGEMSVKCAIIEGQAYPLDKVQKNLDGETAILGWLDVEKGKKGWTSWAYLIRRQGPVAWARLAQASDSSGTSPFDHMGVYRDLLGSFGSVGLGTAGAIRAGAKRWSERLAPLAKNLKDIKHLIVIPSGAMLGVPVEALVDDQGRYFADQCDISYVPSATIYTWLEERSKARRVDVDTQSLLVGDPPFQEAHLAAMEQGGEMESACIGHGESSTDAAAARYVLARNTEALASLHRLPCTRMEVETIAALLQQPKILVGPDASEQALAAMADTGGLRKYRTLHFATHGFVDDERPDRSALILSQVNLPDPLEAAMAGTRIYDGLVTAREVLREWKLDADLVTLSACETGLGRVVGGEGYVGFAHAFLQAGARSLLVSLWKVEDRATSLLMRRFYENWTGAYEDTRHGHKGKAMSKAEALQEAKQYLRTCTGENGERPFEHPYFWSAFILIGDRN